MASDQEGRVHQNRPKQGGKSVAGIIIKIVNGRSKKYHRYGTVYEGLTVQGGKVFFGAISSNARTSIGALLEAMLEAVLTDFSRFWFLAIA